MDGAMSQQTKWQKDKKWSDRYTPEIKIVCASYLITEPPIEEDMYRNSDLMVLKMDHVRIACRIRRYPDNPQYHNEFTIREGRPNGNKTELTKIIEGWGDFLFYGVAAKDEKSLASYVLGDLNVFRAWFQRETAKRNKGCLPGISKSNHDGSSTFRIFTLSDLPPEFVVTRKEFEMPELAPEIEDPDFPF